LYSMHIPSPFIRAYSFLVGSGSQRLKELVDAYEAENPTPTTTTTTTTTPTTTTTTTTTTAAISFSFDYFLKSIPPPPPEPPRIPEILLYPRNVEEITRGLTKKLRREGFIPVVLAGKGIQGNLFFFSTPSQVKRAINRTDGGVFAFRKSVLRVRIVPSSPTKTSSTTTSATATATESQQDDSDQKDPTSTTYVARVAEWDPHWRTWDSQRLVLTSIDPAKEQVVVETMLEEERIEEEKKKLDQKMKRKRKKHKKLVAFQHKPKIQPGVRLPKK